MNLTIQYANQAIINQVKEYIIVNLAFFIFSSSQAAKTILTPAQVTEIIVSTAVIPISHEIKLPINSPVVLLSSIHLSDPGS